MAENLILGLRIDNAQRFATRSLMPQWRHAPQPLGETLPYHTDLGLGKLNASRKASVAAFVIWYNIA